MKLVLATQNKNKLTEIRDMLPKEWKVYTLDQVGIHKELVEEGDTIEQNALQKADFVFTRAKKPYFINDLGCYISNEICDSYFISEYTKIQNKINKNFELIFNDNLNIKIFKKIE